MSQLWGNKDGRKGGISVMAGSSKADQGRALEYPYGQIGEECWVEKGVDCWKSRVIYQLECLLCGYHYRGSTGTSLHKKVRAHMKALRRTDR